MTPDCILDSKSRVHVLVTWDFPSPVYLSVVVLILPYLTHWPLGDLNVILKLQFSILLYWLVFANLLMIMSSDECYRTLLMISQHWFRQWLGAIRQQAITWTSVDQDLHRHMASLGPNELTISTDLMMKVMELGYQCIPPHYQVAWGKQTEKDQIWLTRFGQLRMRVIFTKHYYF